MGIRILIATCLVLLSAQAYAASTERLTPSSIQNFLNESSRMTNPESGYSKKEIREFLDNHIASRADFITNIIYDIEGYPPQMRKMELSKKAFIQNVTDSVGKMQDYSSFSKLIQHDITGAGRKADIVVVTGEKGFMPVEGTMVPFDGKTRCSQILSWKTPHGIVIESANCETILTIIATEQE